MDEWINDVSVNLNGADFVHRVGLVWVVPLAHYEMKKWIIAE